MDSVPDGNYRFSEHGGYLAFLRDAPSSPVVLSTGVGLPPIWKIKNEGDGTVTIWSHLEGLKMHMSYDGAPKHEAPLIAGVEKDKATRWELRPGYDDYHVLIAVPAGLLSPDDKDGLVVDLGRARTLPTPAALMRLNPEDDAQNWRLGRME